MLCTATWTIYVRGDIHRLRTPHGSRGHEQTGERFAVILQSDDLMLSTVLVAPTSRSARASSFRPTIAIGGERTLVLVEQTSAVASERLGQLVGHVSCKELDGIDDALRIALQLD